MEDSPKKTCETSVDNSRKRRKLTSACNECRRSKTKCDENNPCGRCTKRGTACEFSPQKRRGARKKAKLSTTSDCSTDETSTKKTTKINTSSQNIRSLLDIYFRYFNPAFMYPIARSDLENPTNASKEMQLYISLSFASRTTKNTAQTKSFEEKVRVLAGEVFDSFTEATALAFSLLSCYYWGQEQSRSTYYSTMTRGICKQVGPKVDPAKLVLIEAMASCCVTSYGAYVEDLMKRMEAAYEASTIDVYKRQLRVALLLLEVKFALLRAYPLPEGQKYITVLLEYEKLAHSISPEESSALISKLDFIERIMTSEHNIPIFGHVWPLLSPIFNNFRGMLHFVKGDLQLGVDVAIEIIENCSRNTSILIFCPPALVLCIHISFCVLYLTNNVPLAAKAVSLLRLLGKVLPIADIALSNDARRLQSLINRNNQEIRIGQIIDSAHISAVEHSLILPTFSSIRTNFPSYNENAFARLFEGENFDGIQDFFVNSPVPPKNTIPEEERRQSVLPQSPVDF